MLKCYGRDLWEMAGHDLAGAQSQTILCYPGQVVQQAERHRCVLLVGYTVLQLLPAAGELAEKKQTVCHWTVSHQKRETAGNKHTDHANVILKI